MFLCQEWENLRRGPSLPEVRVISVFSVHFKVNSYPSHILRATVEISSEERFFKWHFKPSRPAPEADWTAPLGYGWDSILLEDCVILKHHYFPP